MTPSARFSPSIVRWTVVAMVAGLALGILGNVAGLTAISRLSEILSPLGTIWMNALQMTVIPLVVTQLLAAMVSPDREGSIGALGGRAVGLMLAMLLAGGVLTCLVAGPALSLYKVPAGLASSLRMETIPQVFMDAANRRGVSLGEWLVGLFPPNPLEAAANGDILQLLVFTVLVGAAVSRLPPDRRAPLGDLFRSLADAMLVLVSWVLWGTPVGIFALILAFGLGSGFAVVGMFGVYLSWVCGLLLLVTLLLYPLTVVLGRVSLGDFARAVRPAQLVAVGTQSSLASLPALVEGGRKELRLPGSATGFVLPLCVSTFKMNQTVSPTFKFLFAAHVFGVPLGVVDMATFLAGTTLISFSVVGVPRGGGGFRTLPLYLALGVPIEGYIVMEAIKYIPDMLMTLLNVTADMSVATILSRDSRKVASALEPNTVPVGALASDSRKEVP